ncbi:MULTISPECIES: hypothetical protein [Burkholderia]|uniref:hypothetical protein n=1 Tax=Burkholderia TaxID=32008 RepID=UPI001269F316|nr:MULTISPECIES: hypothetical protein [Burkholderia]
MQIDIDLPSRQAVFPNEIDVSIAFPLHTIDRSLRYIKAIDIRHCDSSPNRNGECKHGETACSGQDVNRRPFHDRDGVRLSYPASSRAQPAIVMRGGPVDQPAALARLRLRATLVKGTGRDSSVVRDQ